MSRPYAFFLVLVGLWLLISDELRLDLWNGGAQ